MPLVASIICLFLCLVVDCPGGFNCCCKGDAQCCCIAISIAVEHIYQPAVLVVWCIEDTAPTRWSFVDSRTQPLGANHGLRCQYRNWIHFSVAIMTSALPTKWHCQSSFSFYTQVLKICSLVLDAQVVECVSAYAMVCMCRYRNCRRFPAAMLTSAQHTKWKIMISLLHTSAHNMLYDGGCWSC